MCTYDSNLTKRYNVYEYRREIALAKALSAPISEETMNTKETVAPVSTSFISSEPTSSAPDRPRSGSSSSAKPCSGQGIGPRGAPIKVIREREQIPEDHISPVSTLTHESR